MSKKQPKKKVVVTKSKTTVETSKKTTSRIARSRVAQTPQGEELLFGKNNFILMAAGVALMVLGYAAMTGGAQPSPDVWDESIIYSFRRITLGPLLVLAGIGVEIFAIFKR